MVETAVFENSNEKICKVLAQRRLTWAGPLGMIAARTLLIVLAQVLVALIFLRLRNPDPLRASTAWWQVTGTLVDLGCLALLYQLTRREGLRLWDIIGLDRSKLRRDMLLGLGILVVMLPIVMHWGMDLFSAIVMSSIG